MNQKIKLAVLMSYGMRIVFADNTDMFLSNEMLENMNLHKNKMGFFNGMENRQMF